MKTVSALDVRKHFGQLLDEAAAGEHIVIERAGEPRAALVPLDVLEQVEPDRIFERRREALRDLQRMARLNPPPEGFDAAAAIRQMREERTEQIARNIRTRKADPK